MSDNSGNGVVVVASGLIVILLLVIGGVAFYYVVERQKAAAAMAAQRARVAEKQAMMAAVNARDTAKATADAHDAARNRELSTVDGDAIRAAVEAVLRAQEEAWNRGDIDTFVEHYWKSDELTFSSGGKTTRGWNPTLARYREKYPTREKMGRLTLSSLVITPLGDSAALVLGEWKLDREDKPLSGNFSLVLRKFDDRWLIVHDHTSQLME